MKQIGIVLAAVLALVSSPASGSGRATGNSLLLDCKQAIQLMEDSSSGVLEQAVNCMSYISGFRDALTFSAKQGGQVCVPMEVTSGQAIRVVIAGMEANPATLHKDAAFHVFLALRTAYPCNAAGPTE